MNLTPDHPQSRRAVREARQATGEQPSVTELPPTVEDTGTTGSQVVVGPDGQPLTRRRLREFRETGLISTITPASIPVAEAPVVAEVPEPAAPEVVESEPAPAPVSETAPQLEVAPAASETLPQPEVQSAFAPRPASKRPPQMPTWTAPAGHWTRQLEVEDEVEMTASREVGGASSTASMLVVNQVPNAADLGGPLGETGEVLLTGSISLRPDFAATGAITGIHHAAEFDDHFDSARPATGASATPVKASAVASQHALGTPIIAGAKPSTSRAINVLIVTAAVLAVLVTGLVVTAVVLRWI